MYRISLISILIFLLGLNCNIHESSAQFSVNLDHALVLTDSLVIDGQSKAFIWIYADHPDYQPVDADHEGIACVDDAGRYLEVLQTEILRNGHYKYLPLARKITHFLLYMSRPDGLWYNFIYSDGSINKTHINSQADFGWWAIRGLRGLAAAYHIFQHNPEDSLLVYTIAQRINASCLHISKSLQNYPQYIDTPLGKFPGWLIKNAPDMNSELILALSSLQETGKFDFKPIIQKIAAGIEGYQIKYQDSDLNGMYLCWENTWHHWGNNQAFALLKAFEITADSTFIQSVKLWADHFLPFMIANNFPRKIVLNPDGTYQMFLFPQIAYGFNATYAGIQFLAELDPQKNYKQNAEHFLGWFAGKNIAGTRMYYPTTGICWDGIVSEDKINQNSGAESTLEALLAMQLKNKPL